MTDLVSHLDAMLVQSGEDVVTFQWMSDEETTVIERAGECDLTVQPWIEGQEDLTPDGCRRFGERSLFLRGLLVAGVDDQTGEPALEPSDELRLVMDARRLGAGYVLARAVDARGRSARNNVLQPRIGSFEEEIDDEGIHLFSACTYRAAVDRGAQWALPHAEHGIQTHTRVPADRWQPWVVNELGANVRAVEIDLFLPGTSGVLEPETWILAEGYEAAVLAVPEGDSLQVTSMTRSRLADRLADRVATSLGVEV